ncbi:protein-glutamate O-methyltransferase CheR [Halobacillus salinarum]|uniref:protein-glutamate O-methyltransferase n=1 Tax=Halobacillus salinarum TaxID=2932257 RepID=A0ABY4EE36_9BACI|nr:protein-glutamate O-methyltransferase CheR [Halobacillus salinarum]UOQ42712.1 protein-glutamate O-methyltransferase CheR [Halobacillus salinarum]
MKEDYAEFTQLIYRKTGIDLSLYKEAQMKRRLTSLRDKRGYNQFTHYSLALFKDENLLQEFMDRITINVSEFYRNKKRWDVLESRVIPYLLKKKRKLRIWSAACSSGEEPYTLAMMLLQFIPARQFEIVATDIDPLALQRAEAAIYSERALNEVPQAVKEKYFVRRGLFFHLAEDVKKCVTFRQHNLLSDPYEDSWDLIVCRNVLIYFTEQAKELIYKNFSTSLAEGGIFFVGSTEQIFLPQKYNLSVYDTFFYQKEKTLKSMD